MSTQTLDRPPFWCIKCGKRVKKATVHIPIGAYSAYDAKQAGREHADSPENTITITLTCHKEVETRTYTPDEYVAFAKSGLVKQYHRAFEPKTRH